MFIRDLSPFEGGRGMIKAQPNIILDSGIN